ncbi:MAG: flagellar biosynthetic protein FliO [Pseudomonadota bacterium]
MKRYFIAAAASLLESPLASAVTSAEANLPVTAAMTGADIARWAVGLMVVLAAIFACAWLVRKLGALPAGAAGALRVVGGISLGARERVVLLQAGKKQLILGVSPGRIQTLHVFDEEEVASMESMVAPPMQGSFSHRFQQAMRGMRRD